MSKFILLALSICLFSTLGFAKAKVPANRAPANAAVDPLAPLPEEAEAPEQNAPTAVVPSDFDLEKLNKEKENEDSFDVHAAVEKYLDENPSCESQRERICKVYILKDKKEKCGAGFKLAESGGWQLNATKLKARQYERSPSQGGVKPPGQGSHKAYGFGVCHKF